MDTDAQELTMREILDRLKREGHTTSYQALITAIYEGRLQVPWRLEKRWMRHGGLRNIRLIPASAYPTIKAYVERVSAQKGQAKRRKSYNLSNRQPPAVVEARMKELRERFPDEDYRIEMLVRLLTGIDANPESEEGVA